MIIIIKIKFPVLLIYLF